MVLCTDSITTTRSVRRFNNIWGVWDGVEGTCPPEYTPFQEVDFGNFDPKSRRLAISPRLFSLRLFTDADLCYKTVVGFLELRPNFGAISRRT